MLFDALRDVAALLDARGRPWALIGGAALIAWVRSRLTDDLDIALTLPAAEMDGFLKDARACGFGWEPLDERFLREGGLLRARSPGGVVVDFMVADDALFAQTVARARPALLGGVAVRVATLEDLLLMKLDAGRPLDLDDAIAIKDAAGTSLDRAYLRDAGARLGLLPALERLLGPL